MRAHETEDNFIYKMSFLQSYMDIHAQALTLACTQLLLDKFS